MNRIGVYDRHIGESNSSCVPCSVAPIPLSISPCLPLSLSPTLPLRPLPDPRISALLAEAERRWGRGALVRWGDAVDSAEVEVISTGFAELDDALGVGGLPCGRISEVFGPDSSGKQALAASLAVQCQKAEGVVAWIDPARRLAPEQMNVQGVEFDSLLVARPENELQALEMAIRLARSGGVKLLVFDLADSCQLSEPRTENREPRGQSSVLSPRHSALNLALRRLVAAVDRNQIAFVFISDVSGSRARSPLTPTLLEPRPARQSALPYESRQGRGEGCPISELKTQNPELPQPSALSPRRSTGGQALRYFASVRLEMERREWIRVGREVVGCRSAVRVVKNKLAPPLREAEVPLRFYRFPDVLP